MSDSVSKYFENERISNFKEKYENRKNNKPTFYPESYVKELEKEIKELKDKIKELEISSFQDLGR